MDARSVAPLYMSDLVMLFLGAFIVALGLERWGVHRRIALRVLGLAGPDPRRQVLAFMAAAAGLSLWINNTSTTLLMLPIALAVLDRLGTEHEGQRRRLSFALLLGIAWSASVGGMGSPVGTAPNQLYLGQLATLFPEAPEVGFASWMLAWLPLVVLWVPLAWWLLTRVLFRIEGAGPDGSAARDALRAEQRAQGPMTPPQRRMAWVFALTALLWVTRADVRLGSVELPGWWRLAAALRGVPAEQLSDHARDITDATVAVAMALVCFLMPARGLRGERLMDWDAAKRLPWEVLLLLGAGFVLAGSFRESGLDRALGGGPGPAAPGTLELGRRGPRGARRELPHRGDLQHRDDRRPAARHRSGRGVRGPRPPARDGADHPRGQCSVHAPGRHAAQRRGLLQRPRRRSRHGARGHRPERRDGGAPDGALPALGPRGLGIAEAAPAWARP